MAINIPSVPATIPTSIAVPADVSLPSVTNTYFESIRGIQGAGKAVRWLDEYGDISNPAVDHSSVFTAAFNQQAIDFLPLCIPAGIFNYSVELSPKGSIYGAGVDWRITGAAAGGTVLRKITALGAGAQIRHSSCAGFEVMNIRFESPNAVENGDDQSGYIVSSNTLYPDRVEHAKFANLMFWKGASGHVLLQRVRNILCTNLVSYSCNKDAFHTTNGGGTSLTWGKTNNIRWENCVVMMPGDDAFPVIGYYNPGVNEQPIIEDVVHSNCVVYGLKRAHAFRPTGVRGYRSTNCSVLGPPAGYAFTTGPLGQVFGGNAAISMVNNGFPCWASDQVEFDNFYVEGFVWAGSSRSFYHAANNDGTGIQKNVRIKGRSANTTPARGIDIGSGANEGGVHNLDFEWNHLGDISGIAIHIDGGRDNKIKLKCTRVGAQSIYVFNDAVGSIDIDMEVVDSGYSATNDMVNIGESSGTFLLKQLDLTFKVTNQTFACDRIMEALTSANTGTCRIGRFRVDVNFPAMDSSDSLMGSFFSQSNANNAYGALTSPAVVPLPNTAAITLSVTTVGAATITSDKAVFNPSDEGKVVRGANGIAGSSVITTWTNSKSVSVNTTTAWTSVGPHAAESWVHGGLLPSLELAYWRSIRVLTAGTTSPVISKGPHPDIHTTALTYVNTGVTNGIITCAPGEALSITWSGGTVPSVTNVYISRE